MEMTLLLQASAVRIFDHPDGLVVGAAFLADTGVVLTCAHVIASALGIAETASTCPKELITLDFPLVAPRHWLTARVLRWVPVQPDGSGDIAVLRLENPAPPGTRITRLMQTENHWEHPFRVFGYPRRHDDGVPAAGKLTSRNAKGWVVMQTTETTGFRVQQGFSGGAVWDGELDGVAGMVVAEENDPAPRVAYMIPSQLLIAVWPALAQLAIPPCPYRGLSAFREQDAPYFFGRQADTQRLVEAVRRKPLIAVIGSSGSGKSSLVYAGLLPQVRKEATWAIVALRPGATPVRALATALLPLLEPQMSALDRLAENKKFTEQLMQGEVHFPDVVAALTQGEPTARLMLVVDQLEELYTLCQDAEEQHNFLDALLAAVQAASHQCLPNVTLVLTLRADFVAQAITYPPLTAALQESSLFLGPMGRAELQEVITRPAEQLHVQLEEGLTRRLIADAGEAEGNLPLLEFALTSLWVRQRERTLTHAAYEAIGGVQQALTDHAQAVYDGLTQDEQHAVRRLFLHHLVRPGEGTQDTRRRAAHSQVGREQWPLVAHLADVRLVVTGYDEVLGNETVEVIHEALIRDWALLDGWLDEDRELLLWRERLRTAQRQWEQGGRDPDGLLRGTLLAEAAQWSSARPDALTAEEQGFIQTSQEHEAQTRAHLEALLEESERRRQEAERQQQIALARGLAAQAELLHTQYPHLLERSALLAVEAAQRFSCLEANQALQNTVDQLCRRLAILRHEDRVQMVTFRPDGHLLATASNEETVGLWDTSNGHRVATLRQESVVAIAFSPDGRLLATGGLDQTAGLWDVSTHRRLFVLPHEDSVWQVVFSPDGHLLATASDDGTAGLWDTVTGHRLATLSHGDYVHAIAFSPDGRLLATYGSGQSQLWEVPSGHRSTAFSLKDATGMVAFSPDGHLLAARSADNTAGLWDTTDGKRLATLPHEDSVEEVVFSPDGRLLATTSEGKTVVLWNVSNGRRLATLRHEGVVHAIVFSPDGRLLATASEDQTAGLWDVSDGRRLAILLHPESERHEELPGVWAVAFSPDGRLLATGSNDGTAGLWDIAGHQRLPILRHEGPVSAVVFSPDGRLLATASEDQTAGLWDVSDGRRLATLPHEDGVNAIAFSPDGCLLATASEDQTAGVWEVVSGQRLAMLHHSDFVNAVTFSPDGHLLATASTDQTARLWLWQLADLIAEARSQLSRNLTQEEWQQYLGDEPYRKTVPGLP